jgi:amino acid adenylation domain-containing protein
VKPSAISRIAAKFSDPRNVSKAVEAQKTRQRAQKAHQAPASKAEETLASIWAKLLGADRVGRNDDFFDMGGHSLLATQMLARVRDAFSVELPLKAVFEAPVLSSFAATVESSARTSAASERPAPQPRTQPMPLSFAQQRLWFLDQLSVGKALYNIPQRYRLFGKLHLAALQSAIDALVHRQEVLRTTFAVSEGGPTQVIAAERKHPVRYIDLSHLDDGEREAEALRLVQEEAVTLFDLAAGPLFRVTVVRVADEAYDMVLNIHHIVFDRWSHTILMDELTQHYRAAAIGSAHTLPALPVQYADYAIWQRRYLEGGVLANELAYWKERLAGAPSVIEFPTDRLRAANDQHRGALEDVDLPSELVARIRDLSQSEGATLFMGLLAAFNVLLSRYSGLDDVVVGSPIANRNLTEIESLIGFFVGTLPLRADLSGDPTFAELLHRVREACLGAYANASVPFEQLVEELHPERSLSHNPVFQVTFALQPEPVQRIELPELRMERRPLHSKTSLFDSSWFAFEKADGGVMLRVEYNADLFEPATIRRLMQQFRSLLEAVAIAPEGRISDLPLLSPEDERRLLVEWNQTTAEYPREKCAHELFEAQAALHPENTAVSAGDGRLTYRELDERANQLAHHLRALGVSRESLVGVCLHRSIEMVVANLAALKAGAAYLPLDPAYPKDRVAFMLQDAQVPVLITHSALAKDLPEFNGVRLDIDTSGPAIAARPTSNLPLDTAPECLAYVIYTSGSTGRPKGVEIPHRGLMNLIAWHQREYSVVPSDRATQVATPAFDASVWETWPYLASGAAIHIPDDEIRSSPERLLQWLSREEITLSFLPTPLAEAVLDELAHSPVELCLRALLTGGDKLRKRPGSSLSFRLMNHYGPTENSVVTTWTAVSSGDGAPPIGKPIANTRVYILDAKMRPVPPGVAGELYVGGDGLARGYRGRPDLSAERFVDLPGAGERVYRTGDRVRFLADGNIEFLGRLDQQVKVRGFRIELGEIESVLGKHPAVKECVVVPRATTAGETVLAVYVVARAVQPSSATLQDALKAQLPEYMVPTAFVFLPKLPITQNGKIDTRALPDPELTRAEAVAYVAPRTALEARLCDIWAEVLHREQVGIRDNFFSAGGHSLMATQVISRVRKSEGVEAPLRTLFEAPTIAEMAQRIEQMKRDQQFIPIPRVPRDGHLPLSFAQQRLWFLDQLDPGSSLYNAPWTIRMKGALRCDALQHALNQVVQRHEVFRTTFAAVDGMPYQVIAAERTLEVPVVDLGTVPAESQDAEVQRLMSEGVRQPFDLQNGPVFRASLLRLNEREHVLLLNSHHIANDGWSLWQFMNELGEFYGAFCTSRPPSLPELPVQYADFAAWQRNWMDGEVLEEQLSYWKSKLAGAPDKLEFPTDRPRPAALSYRGATQRFAFPRSLSDKLKELSLVEGTTLYMTLLAAYNVLLFRYTGQEDLVVGSPIANRTRSDIEGLIGFFVNTMVMRTDVSGNPTFRELLQRVRESALGAYAHQDVPFEKVVEVLRPERYLGRIPLFNVWFALQNAPRMVFQLPGLELSSVDVHNGTSKFDFGFFAFERPDGLQCLVEYSTELFDAATIRRLLENFCALLEGIVEAPEQRITDLPLLTRRERDQVVLEWNATAHDYPRERCLHQFIEEQAQRIPTSTALVFESQRLTYQELNERANRLAHRLRKLGAGPEKFIAICVERSIEMVVGLLAIVKAGAAYVPLDPDNPRERLALMLQDVEPPVLLTLERLLEVLPEHNIPTLCLDRDWHTLAAELASDPPLNSNSRDQAYAIYTSGSTGRPKCVPNVHEGIVNRLLWMQDAYRLTADDRVMQKTPYSFDVSVWEFFWPLMTGACLVVARPEGHKDPAYLVNLIREQQITTMHFVPSMLRAFVEAEGVEQCTSLRHVICSGEALPFELQQRFFERLGAELHNLYGPTEASVDVTYWECKRNSERALVPIGRPVWNTQIYILDAHLRAVPIGVAGELHIGGVQLARGYLKRPELTAEKFIDDPFRSEPDSRLYKTGDLARFLPDGNIEYLGRIDHQVKIRGFRIELGEIESTLESHPGVQRSVVMAREDNPGEKRLVAYIVPASDFNDTAQPQDGGGLSTEQVSEWTVAFDEAYRRGQSIAEATFNITGWDSSYTGTPIDAAEMRVWVESTVDRICALDPKRVWEIGCGTGLLLFRIAPDCEQYLGTDISTTALTFVQQQLDRMEPKPSNVALAKRPAHVVDSATSGKFDLVVLNSIAQYFPSLDYFVQVLENAADAIGTEGTVFLGDLRSLPLLETFHASVVLCRAQDAITQAQLRQRVQKSMQQEGELLLDPQLFTALRQRIPRIRRVDIQLKRGRAHNELTRFRYDVALHIGDTPESKVDCAWLDWKRQALTPEALREILSKTAPDLLGVSGVPDRRVCSEVAALRMILNDEGAVTAGQIRERALKAVGVEPEDLWSIEDELPYRVEIRPSPLAADGCFDVLFRRKTSSGNVAVEASPRYPGEPTALLPLPAYANNPLRQRVAGKLVPQVRSYLSSKVPEYMAPSAFIVLDSVPLTPNGKVDRRALPAPEEWRPEGQGDYVAPRTPTEEIVAAAFADVLHLDQVGVLDSFFELGGHSLSATQVVSRVRQIMQIELPVRELFESSTVAALSQAIENRRRAQVDLVAPPIVPAPRNPAPPLSFAQRRLWVLDQMEPNNPLYNVPRALRVRGEVNAQALETALNGIVARHEILRTAYRDENGQPVQVILPELHVPLVQMDFSGSPDPEKEARRFCQADADRPFDLANEAILRTFLMKLAQGDHILLLNTHHIANDGWSNTVFNEDLCALYGAALDNKPSTLAPLTIQYADYAVWQRNWLQGEVLQKQVAYWRERLDGAPPVLALPTDRPRPDVQQFRGALYDAVIPAHIADRVRTVSRQQGATAFMTMLAAFKSLVFYLTKQPDVVLGTDIAGRNSLQTEALIGFFVNLLVLRTDLSGEPSFAESLKRVREVTLGAYTHQDVPFDKLVEELRPERSLSHNPLVQVLFVQQGGRRGALDMPGLELTPFMLDVPSKFDLAVFVREMDSGILSRWVYSPDLFDASTIARTSMMFQIVLEQVTANPEITMSALTEVLAETDRTQRAAEHKQFQSASLQKLKSVKRKVITGV